MIPTMDEKGTGGLYLEDPRDWPIEDLFASADEPVPPALPLSYRVPSLGPVLDQGVSPKCVAFSGSTVKAQQDRIDQGAFFNFDEARFFTQIGGTSAGAYISAALKQMRDYGYPTVAGGDRAEHKISAYYRVPALAGDLKAAIKAFGPLWVIGQWYREWHRPNSGGVLPAPVTKSGGHAVVFVGWDNRGFWIRNSWGTDYGVSGDCLIRYEHLDDFLWAAYKTVDVRTLYAKTVACPAELRATKGTVGGAVGAKLGSIKAGVAIRVRPLVRGADWTERDCAAAFRRVGDRWYPIAEIAGKPVSEIYAGRELVYIKRGAIKGG